MTREVDLELLERAARLSLGGFPAPNPRVGCVITRDHQIIGEGFHASAGGAHAEVAALESCTRDPSGGTAYITLEPCNHTGRTGPCSQALLAAGIRRVVYAAPDPNPRAQGGAEFLRQRGLQVEQVTCEQAMRANWLFLRRYQIGRAVAVGKVAITADGFIARPDGSSKWITGQAARTDAHRLRAEMGAVLVGRSTAEIDAAELTVRHIPVTNQPLRVVIDPKRRLGDGLPIFNRRAETRRFCERPITERDRVWNGPEALLKSLGEEGQIGVLIEGGASTLHGFLAAGLLDRLIVYQSKTTFGEGRPWSSLMTLDDLKQAYEFESVEIGPDTRLTFDLSNSKKVVD